LKRIKQFWHTYEIERLGKINIYDSSVTRGVYADLPVIDTFEEINSHRVILNDSRLIFIDKTLVNKILNQWIFYYCFHGFIYCGSKGGIGRYGCKGCPSSKLE
jgi:hypothetical protein